MSKFKKINKNNLVMIAGGSGMVGSAILRKLKENNFNKVIAPSSSQLDLRNQTKVNRYLKKEKPDHIFICAGKVGGIKANDTFKAQFLYDNLIIQANLIHGAHLNNINSLMYFGTSCIYPKYAKQPLKENYLLTGGLEKTNEGYALAKISGIKMCEYYNFQYGRRYFSVMPTNLYGPNDNYDLKNSHVLPALLLKMHKAKIKNQKNIELWGTGKPKREFLHVDDLAEACIRLITTNHNYSMINIGSGKDLTIRELAKLIKQIVGYKGDLKFNKLYDGTPRKLLDISKIKKLGWKNKISLKAGITKLYEDELKNKIFNS